MKDVALTAVLFFLMAFLYPIYVRLGELQEWQPLKPADARAITLGMILGVAAICVALGINLKPLVDEIRGFFGGGDEKPKG